ncbi:hypothetical protein [Rubinisphaera sp.]|uniref:hypothetical protein n=1 Tax=Rubinisphaera sp. TaxID=2024857 RepID=UPI0025CB7E23|nr:hypothetical protein [Rubinisphaera sp.]|tara:strand:- start:1611 stop:2306 length:696 start_codon:yes stop_codon:yes gene_type:complete
MRAIAWFLILSGTVLTSNADRLQAQDRFPDQRYYHPLNHHHMPPGMAGMWAGALGRADLCYFQPVQIRLPGSGQVTFLQSQTHPAPVAASPAQAGFMVGPLYRIKLSNIEGYPGLELYPTLELMDRLHPPAHLRQTYPIPVDLTEEDIEKAAQDQLVTKIIYIEQPDIALPQTEEDRIREEELPKNRNLMEEADLRGRPVLILRIGGRIPSPHELNDPRIMPPLPLEFVTE